MAVFKTALILVHVAVSILAWENIPSIPANRRAQYYLQHDDGGYKFGYDTGEGHSGKASADAANQVQGEYSYVDGTGQRVNWQYTAGDGGFVPVINGASSGGAVAKASGFSSRAHTAPAVVVSAASEDPDYDENADASYNFNIDTDSYKRTESSDNKGNIQGQYSYNSPVGGSHAISYIAGEGTGFVVTSDAASPAATGYSYPAPAAAPGASPAAAAYDGQTQVAPDGSFAFSYTTADHSHDAVADAQNNVRGSYSFVSQDDGQTRKIDYQAGSATGYVASGAHLPVAPSGAAGASPVISAKSYSPAAHAAPASRRISEPSNAQTNINPDGSFSYSYTTGDHSKQETADANNNVRGSFSFKAKDDGKTRRVDYIAGADTGFLASGDHLPVAPSPVGAGFKSATSQASTSIQHSSNTFSSAAASASASSSSAIDGQTDGSYSFSYQTGDHSHQANADPQGNVAGRFSYVAKDGVARTVDYTAGADKGFIAKGAHLPVAPAPGAAAAPAALSNGGGYQYSAPASNAFSSDDQSNSDGSYSYSYDAGTSSKHETADARGNVKGSFSFIGGDGVNRKLTYTARGEEGFLAQGDHLPAAPAAAPGQEVGLAAPNAFAHSDLFSGSAAAKSGSDASTGSVKASKDGAYSYSYKTGGQSSSAASLKSSSTSQNNFASAAKPYSSSASQGAATGHVKASKDGAYSYSYATGGENAASSKAASGHGSSATSYSAPASSAAATGHVKASKDGAYSYSYSTGGQSAASKHGAAAATTYSAAGSSDSGTLSAGSQADDGSYSFSYDAGTHSHEQSADAKNNVRGSFSFKAKDDGQVRKVEYSAGSATGFLAKGAHLPVAPAGSGGAPAPVSAYSSAAPAPVSAYSSAASGHDATVENNGDGSYSYSYDAGTSSKQETADANGNVMGSFSFIGGDGVNRQLSYTAKNEEGFQAAGAHLPVAPTLGGGSSASHFKSSAFSSSASSSASSSSSSASHRFSSNLPASTSLLSRSDGNAIISRYLPPDSPHKFGYIYDTQA